MRAARIGLEESGARPFHVAFAWPHSPRGDTAWVRHTIEGVAHPRHRLRVKSDDSA
ncbi:MAG: hypothetical protein R2911_43845 [Caldilineaceae bacterium]